MSRQIQIRRGSAAEHSTFTGAIGEITMDTTNKTLRVHDGETVGGIALARKDEISQIVFPFYVPDYSARTQITGNTFTATENGFIYMQAWNGVLRWKVSNLTPSVWLTAYGTVSVTGSNLYPIVAGQSIEYDSTSASESAIYFCPLQQ